MVKGIAEKLRVTSSQLLLVWALQQDATVIPEGTTPQKLKEHATCCFIIPDDDFEVINALGQVKCDWDRKNIYTFLNTSM